MSERRAIDLGQEHRDFLAQIRARRPRYKSAGGALLAEILTGRDLSHRVRSGLIFGLEGYRRGLPRLEPLIADLVKTVEASDDPWVGPPERELLYQTLWVLARMDTPPSHARLARLLHESTSHLVRADVLEAMAFEENRYELALILPFASAQVSTPEILSALYALQYKYANARPEEARERVAPLLKHPYPMVRTSAIEILKEDGTNIGLIRSLENDPEAVVRDRVAEAIRYIEWIDEA